MGADSREFNQAKKGKSSWCHSRTSTPSSTRPTLRMHLVGSTGFPRVSSGATVNGVYVPRGVAVQLGSFTAQRHPQFFTDPLELRPERGLPTDHPMYDARYTNDNLKAFFPFSLGPRQCSGRGIAWFRIRLFLGGNAVDVRPGRYARRPRVLVRQRLFPVT
ncbi:cytochrome P450 [Podospora didyma]|uniref:Cytochrome P450 n=1 Tax=Podospora didyma TaxID=330526 RepID=A0AAE0U8V3_9PEZI|nr:cytochrome P450 [Podospora didyma]